MLNHWLPSEWGLSRKASPGEFGAFVVNPLEGEEQPFYGLLMVRMGWDEADLCLLVENAEHWLDALAKVSQIAANIRMIAFHSIDWEEKIDQITLALQVLQE